MGLLQTMRTWVTGETVTAAYMNSEIRDPLTGIQAAWATDSRASTVIWTGTGTSPALGNGTIVSRYRQIGKTTDWELRITMGSTTTFGSAGWILTPPVTPANTYLVNAYSRAYDVSLSSTLGWQASVDLVSAALQVACPATTQPNADRLVTSAIPFAWATGDVLSVNARFDTV